MRNAATRTTDGLTVYYAFRVPQAVAMITEIQSTVFVSDLSRWPDSGAEGAGNCFTTAERCGSIDPIGSRTTGRDCWPSSSS